MYIDKYFHKLKHNYFKKRAGEPNEEASSVEWWHWTYDIVITILFLLMLLTLLTYAYTRPPRHFPVGEIITIEEGQGIRAIAKDFEEAEIIESSSLFTFYMFLSGNTRSAVAGDYYFERPADMVDVARRVSQGDFGLTPLSITIPEGLSVSEVADILDKEIHSHTFSGERFIEIAEPFEGYLFPDTYFFLPNVREEEVVRRMRENFVERVSEIGYEIAEFGRPLEEVIVMASLVEREASIYSDRQKIAGVLWNRLEIDMPLQVDAVFPYILGKNTFELTLEDLGYDSPQNTYRYPGLPPIPIVSPGLNAIRAVVNPIESEWLFYLADKEGNTHFAETFEEHVANRRQFGI